MMSWLICAFAGCISGAIAGSRTSVAYGFAGGFCGLLIGMILRIAIMYVEVGMDIRYNSQSLKMYLWLLFLSVILSAIVPFLVLTSI